MIDIKVPTVGESISEVTLLKWVKADGSYVERDEVIAELESEKATFEVNAVKAGVLKTLINEGDNIAIGAVMAKIDETAPKPATEKQPPKEEVKTQAEAAPSPSPVKAAAQAVGKGKLEVKVPVVGESISEVTVLKWIKHNGDLVKRDEVIAELESEKATFEINAVESGQLSTSVNEGDTIKIGDVAAIIDTDVAVPEESSSSVKESQPATADKAKAVTTEQKPEKEETTSPVKATPVAAAIIADKKIDPQNIVASGTAGRILKGDVLAALANPGKKAFSGQELFTRNTRKQKMSNLRKTISRRLVESKNGTAMLTTFNELDMSRILEIRKAFKDKFKEIHGVGLGFMSFFAKACAIALSDWPAVNAQLDGEELVFHDYADISIAVSTPRGLTVPVMRNVESLSMADIEKKVIELANKARDNKLTLEELQGGTFTITNGGVFGSLMSTPIINLPQAAILGMHKIQERPVALNGQVVIKPMMYIALSYDHRIIDGRESVSFLVRVKELLENPEMLLLGKDPVKTLLEL